MDIGTLITLLAAWNILGFVILLISAVCSCGWFGLTDGFEFVNPCYIYKHCTSVNWFGAAMLALFFALICPVGAVCYWFYKLCTVGRK